MQNMRKMLSDPVYRCSPFPQYLGHTLWHNGRAYNYALTAYVVNRNFLNALAPQLAKFHTSGALLTGSKDRGQAGLSDGQGIDGGLLCHNKSLSEKDFHTEDDFAGNL